MQLNTVVLPAPLGPISAVMSVRPTLNETSSTASEPTEAHGEVLDLEQRVFLPGSHALPSSTRSLGIGRALPSAIDGVRVPTMPRGRQTMMPTMATPNSSMR